MNNNNKETRLSSIEINRVEQIPSHAHATRELASAYAPFPTTSGLTCPNAPVAHCAACRPSSPALHSVAAATFCRAPARNLQRPNAPEDPREHARCARRSPLRQVA